jgi:hypothetical protein
MTTLELKHSLFCNNLSFEVVTKSRIKHEVEAKQSGGLILSG